MPHHGAQHHHHAPHEAREAEPDVATAVSVVYVTAAKTFDGPVGSYSTPAVASPQGQNQNGPNFFDGGSAAGVQNAPLAAGGQQQPPSANTLANKQPAPSAVPLSVAQSSAIPSMIMAPSNSAADSAVPSNIQSQASSAMSTALPSSAQTTFASSVSAPLLPAKNTNAQAQVAPTAAPTAQQTKSSGGGMSGGAKAGLAIGMLLLVAILAGIGFLFYRKKKSMDAEKRQLDDEKSTQAAGLTRGASVTSPNSNAPRLSLKPSNDAFGQEMNEKQAAAGGLAPVAAPTTRGRTPEPANATLPSAEATDPFGDHAKLPENSDPALAPKPLNVSRPGTPTQGEKAAPAAAGADGPNGPLNVHRVQLDFAPSMDDELGLRQGQLVRMLHEYDDGWCLCIRLDRSQQGVVPRSCISKSPVKPRPPPGQRPKGPPPSNSRPGTPQGADARPRAGSNAPAPLKTSRPATPNQGPFGEGEYRAPANGAPKSPTYEASMLSNSPNQSPPSSPETKQEPLRK